MHATMQLVNKKKGIKTVRKAARKTVRKTGACFHTVSTKAGTAKVNFSYCFHHCPM